MLTGLSHVAIAVPDLAAAVRQLEDKYGLTASRPQVNAAQHVRLACIEINGATIELMEPTGPASPLAKFLARNPRGGIHHFALAVNDMETTLRDLAPRGVRPLGDGRPQHNVSGGRIAFLHPADFCGALVELEEHGGAGASD